MKLNIRLAVVCTAIVFIISGCTGQGKNETAEVTEAETTTAVTEAESGETLVQELEIAADTYEDNYDVDSSSAAGFAEKIKEAVAAEDMEGLSELIQFPLYVGLPGVGGVETREEFMELGADSIFTEELKASIAGAETDSLTPSEAGFVLSDGSSANVIFGVMNGVLSITGINY